MKKYIFEAPANAKGLQDVNIIIKALNDPIVAAVFDYTVEFKLRATDEQVIHRVTWFFRYEEGKQR